MIKNITPSHLPKGTVIKTSLHVQNTNGEIEQHYYKGEQLPNAVSFVVDHIVVNDGFDGRNFIVYTTTPKTNPLYEGDDFYHFNIDHVSQIVSIGHKVDIRYKAFKISDFLEFNDKNNCYSYALKSFIANEFVKLQPHNLFRLTDAVNGALNAGVFIGNKDTRLAFTAGGLNLTPIERFVTFKVNQKKLKKWAKQNVNRYILSNAEMKKQEEEAQDEMYKDMENDFDHDYLQLKNHLMNPEEKVRHDGLYGGCTEADFV